ncbi:peptide methionine sulfoxide reductase MsrB-like isoform X2 [Oratosquilla oratoria]
MTGRTAIIRLQNLSRLLNNQPCIRNVFTQMPVRHLSCATVLKIPFGGKDPKTITDEEWQKHLTPEQFSVTRDGGTEPPFSGAFYNHKDEGLYLCVCCGTQLFSSASKFESGSGWPSFHSTHSEEKKNENSNIVTKTDTSYDMVRTEVSCKE